MNARERILAIVHHVIPDKLPFAPLWEYVPRGDFERELRSRGMGWMTRTPLWYSEHPNVVFERRVVADRVTTIAHTPVGSVSSSVATHLDRRTGNSRSLLREGWLKSVKDYDPILFMIEDEVFCENYGAYDRLNRAFAGDGLVRSGRFDAPYWLAYGYFGLGSPEGATNFVYHQVDHPDHFAALIEALERRNERLFPVVANCPAELIEVGAVDGIYGPTQYERYFLAFYEKYVPLLHARGKIVYPHAHSSRLKDYADLLTRSGVGMLDAFTPPPVGNLSLAEARAIWGDRMVIAVNFPETIFWWGPQATKSYTSQLLRENAGGPLILGMTEIGTSMIADDEMDVSFKAGMRAVMDAIDEHCG